MVVNPFASMARTTVYCLVLKQICLITGNPSMFLSYLVTREQVCAQVHTVKKALQCQWYIHYFLCFWLKTRDFCCLSLQGKGKIVTFSTQQGSVPFCVSKFWCCFLLLLFVTSFCQIFLLSIFWMHLLIWCQDSQHGLFWNNFSSYLSSESIHGYCIYAMLNVIKQNVQSNGFTLMHSLLMMVYKYRATLPFVHSLTKLTDLITLDG